MLTSKDTKNARIQLVDFGCAHKVHGPEEKEDHSHRGTASTPAYCPPEVLKVYKNKHAHIEPGFDLWSLGVILYVMLTGMHPFDPEGGSTNDQIEARVIAGEVPPLKKDVSGDARALIEGLMNMDPSQRWTAGQLLEHPWVQGKTASSRKIPKSDDRLRTYRRHKTAVGKHFFRTMLMQSSMAAGAADDTTRSNMCLLESAFRQLDQNDLGYLSTKTLHGDTSFFGADAQLSLSEVSDLLSENMANRYLPKGHVLYSEGEKGDSMFFLNSGSVEVTSKEGLAKVREAGDFFGEDALTRQDKVYGNTVVCKTAVHVIEVSREYYEKYVQADESVALTMAETDRLRGRERANTILSLQKSMKHKDYQRGDTIFEQGSAGDNLYIVEEGNVDIFRDGHKVRSLHKGEMTGEHAAYHKHKPYNVSARCVGDSCKMGILKSTDMHRLFKKNPSLEASFYDIILRRDFKKAICSATKRPFPETEGDLRAAFEVIDTNKSGVLELDKLRRVMLDFDPSYKEEDIQTLLKSMDLSKSGSLTWKEFKHVFGMAKES
jgi:CRP-like cAMP-binding protein